MTFKQTLTYKVASLPTSYIPKIEDFLDAPSNSSEKSQHKISAFNESAKPFKEPKLSQWEYLNPEDVEKLVNCESRKKMVDFIGGIFCKDQFKPYLSKAKFYVVWKFMIPSQIFLIFLLKDYSLLNNSAWRNTFHDICLYTLSFTYWRCNCSTLKLHSNSRSKELFIELLCDTVKFCKELNFNVEKTGTALSQIYLAHLYFMSSCDITAEKIYIYFKDLTMCHSLPFPPSSKKVFTLKEAKEILEFFCKIYLRNLPLIRYLCLPNFALCLNYEIPPAPTFHLKDKKTKNKTKGKKKK